MVTRTAAVIAQTRSLEAELATEAVAEDSTDRAHQEASQLHTEAAKWRRQSGDHRRAMHHDAFARVHSRIAARLSAGTGPGEEDDEE